MPSENAGVLCKPLEILQQMQQRMQVPVSVICANRNVKLQDCFQETATQMHVSEILA